MAHVDRRDQAKVYQDGSSLIAAGLTAEQAIEVFGTGSVAAWYGLGYQGGGNLGRDTNAQRVYDESGEEIGTTSQNDDFVITNTSQQTDAATLKLHDWLEKNAVPIRYILPTKDPDVVQVHYHPSMKKDVGSDQISTAKGVRTKQFTLRGKKSLHVFDDVAADQSDWDTAGLGDAEDTTFAAA